MSLFRPVNLDSLLRGIHSMFSLRQPFYLHPRVRNCIIGAVALYLFFGVYRYLWDDISSPIPYSPWTPERK